MSEYDFDYNGGSVKDKEPLRQEIIKHTKEFIERGGVIQIIAPYLFCPKFKKAFQQEANQRKRRAKLRRENITFSKKGLK